MRLRPAAEKPFGGWIGDAVDAAFRATRRRPVHRACAAPAAGTVHVEEDGTIAFAQRLAIDGAQAAANRLQRAGRNMTGDDRVGDTRQTTVPQVDVGTAHFGSRGPQQRRAVGEIRPREFANLDRFVRPGHDGGEDAVAHGVR